MNRYAIYPSLLDSYNWMMAADDEAAYIQRRQELLDKINRLPHETSYAAARGTALNELVDDFIGTPVDKELRMLTDANGEQYMVNTVEGFECAFACDLIRRIGERLEGAVPQMFFEAEIETEHGVVRLYGYPDYICGDVVTDLKTTSTYAPGKFRDHWQHLVYSYGLVRGGYVEKVTEFNYLVAELQARKDGVLDGEVYNEQYAIDVDECERVLRRFLDYSFLPFVEQNRELITDNKIFGL